jgi:hypothetical protein
MSGALEVRKTVLPTSECFATSRLQEANGFQSVDPLNALRFQVARSRSKSLQTHTNKPAPPPGPWNPADHPD